MGFEDFTLGFRRKRTGRSTTPDATEESKVRVEGDAEGCWATNNNKRAAKTLRCTAEVASLLQMAS